VRLAGTNAIQYSREPVPVSSYWLAQKQSTLGPVQVSSHWLGQNLSTIEPVQISKESFPLEPVPGEFQLAETKACYR
jgi:hypothetical protein